MIEARIARLQSRARIETHSGVRGVTVPMSIARLQSRARIETSASASARLVSSASPGCKAGRGLKLVGERRAAVCTVHRPAAKPGAD